ncbi:MAG: hypothetical protein EBS39_01845 [Gammaproteobacteria bacterium]|nr:hypothetical protein [Gammaproteobacteria bacterium]
MVTRWEWLVGTRHLRSAHRRGFVSFVAAISVVGLALGVAVLVVVLSVMNGFERELRSRMLSVTSHATLTGLEGSIADWRAARTLALRQPGVLQAVPFIESQAMLARGQRVLGTAVRGIDPALEAKATGLGQRLSGARLEDLQPGSWRIILGAALAAELGASRGDTLVLIAPEGSATPEGVVPRMRRVTVAGTFSSGMYEFDRGLALLNVADAARLYHAVPRPQRLLHGGPAGGRGVGRRGARLRRRLPDVRAGDALSRVARRAYAAGGGPAT